MKGSKEKEGSGGIKFWVLGVGAKADGKLSLGDEQTHVFKLKLTPRYKGGRVAVTTEEAASGRTLKAPKEADEDRGT